MPQQFEVAPYQFDCICREYPEGVDPYQPHASRNIDVVASSNTGIIQPDLERHNRHYINHVDATTPPLLPNVDPSAPPYLFDNNIPPAPAFRQYYPKSPLFDKYYRPSPDEIQRVNDLSRPRAIALPPVDVTPLPDAQRDRQSEQRAVFQEYHLPYSTSGTQPTDSRYLAPISPGQPPNDPYRPLPYQYSQQPHTLEPQTPAVYLQPYDGQGFLPASTYGGPHLPSAATFNQPYPTNIPIYNSQSPQIAPTFSQAPPENIPVYGQSPVAGQANVYYAASASRPQPTVVAQQ